MGSVRVRVAILVLVAVCYTGTGFEQVNVGVIVDLDTPVGNLSYSSMLKSLSDFYTIHHNYSTRISLHLKDSKSDSVQAASAAIQLLKNEQVHAIVGPLRSTQADFVIDIGNACKVPVISLARSAALSPESNPYFIRASQCSSFQARAIAALVGSFDWRQVVLIYEDNEYGSGVIPYLTDALLEVNALVKHRVVISPNSDDNEILKQLYKLMTMQTRVFVVNILPSLASRFFAKAKEVGMMRKDYAWILTDTLTSLLSSNLSDYIRDIEGVLGVRPEVPPPSSGLAANVFGVWAYDTIFALGMAVESSARLPLQQHFNKPLNDSLSESVIAHIGTSEIGPKLLPFLRNITFKGLSGDFRNGELQPSNYQIINFIQENHYPEIGLWIPGNLDHKKPLLHTNVTWPEKSTVVPRGWEIPTGERKLKIGVPVKSGFGEFVKVITDPKTNQTIATGYCIEVFKQVIDSLPYAVPYEFVPFYDPIYDDLIQQVYHGKIDAAVGDITIVANRSEYVDFTLPFTESGVSMVVPIRKDERKNAWIFMKPLTRELWITTASFFIFTGFAVWVLEHRVNKEFRGPPHKQVGMIFWFSFSTLVFSHKEKVISNLSRFVVIVWVFVVLILTSSYTASLTSMLTVQQLEPTITDINDLIISGDYVGYQSCSFMDELLMHMNFSDLKLKGYNTSSEYHEALSKGARNGGVAAIVDELPYLRLFLSEHCGNYTLVGPTYQIAGFGFAFPKGSLLVPDVSRAILQVSQGGRMEKISQQLLQSEPNCSGGAKITSNRLALDSFAGVFIIAAVTSASALLIYLLIFLSDNRRILASDNSILQKLYAIAKTFDKEKEPPTPLHELELSESSHSPALSVFYNAEGSFSHDEGFSTTEPPTPLHDSAAITQEQ
jgi:ionotropic glutamate receptor